MATKKTDSVEEDVEFVPSAALVEAMNDEGTGTPEPFGVLVGPHGPLVPERYRILQPWLRHTLVQRLNEEAAAGWRLAAVVDNTIIILERAD